MYMKRTLSLVVLAIFALLFVSCGNTKTEETSVVAVDSCAVTCTTVATSTCTPADSLAK